MTSQPDKLFRDHLEHLKKIPPTNTWSRIESGLDNHSSKLLWLRLAAAILVLMGASFLLWRAGETPKNTATLATHTTMKTEADNNAVSSAIPSTHKPLSSPVLKTEKSIYSPPEKSKATARDNRPVQQEIVDQQDMVKALPEEPLISEAITNPAINSNSSTQLIDNTENPSSTLHSNKIIYSSGEVNSRFLKKDSMTSIPSTEKPSTGIQKILDLASGLKNEESAFSDLREIKDEILSFPIKEQTKEK
jgi:hypothetical protein